MKQTIEQLEKSIDIQEDILLEMQAESRKKEYDIKQMTKLADCLKLLETNTLKGEDAEWFCEYYLQEFLETELTLYFSKEVNLQFENEELSGDGWNEPITGGYTSFGFTNIKMVKDLNTDFATIPLTFDIAMEDEGYYSEDDYDDCKFKIYLNNLVLNGFITKYGEAEEVELLEVK